MVFEVIVDLNEDDILEVYAEGGTKFKVISLMGFLMRPRGFVTPEQHCKNNLRKRKTCYKRKHLNWKRCLSLTFLKR